MANCKQLAAAPRRHQRLPASVLQPPRSPLTEDTSACGKAKHPGHAEPGGEFPLPHPQPGGLHANDKRGTTQFSTQDFIGWWVSSSTGLKD